VTHRCHSGHAAGNPNPVLTLDGSVDASQSAICIIESDCLEGNINILWSTFR